MLVGVATSGPSPHSPPPPSATDPHEYRPAADQPFQTSAEGKLVISDGTHKDSEYLYKAVYLDPITACSHPAADTHSLEDMETDSSKVSAAYAQYDDVNCCVVCVG